MTKFICPYCESEVEKFNPMFICPHCGLYAFIGLNNDKESILENINKLNQINSQLENNESYDLVLEKLQILKFLLRYDEVIETYVYLFNNLTEERMKYLEEFVWDILYYFDPQYHTLSFQNIVRHLQLKASCNPLVTWGLFKPLEEDLTKGLKDAIETFKYPLFSNKFQNEIIWCYKCLLVLEGKNEDYLWEIAEQYSILQDFKKQLNFLNQIGLYFGDDFNLWYVKSLVYNILGETKKSIISCAMAINQKDRDMESIQKLFEILGFDFNEDSFNYLNDVYKDYIRDKYKLQTFENEAYSIARDDSIDELYIAMELRDKFDYDLLNDWHKRGILPLKLAMEEYYNALDLKNNVLDADLLDVWYQKGITHLKLHQYKDANECFDRVIEIVDSWPDAYVCKGLCLTTLSLKEGYWLDYLEKGLFYDANDEVAKNIINAYLDKYDWGK